MKMSKLSTASLKLHSQVSQCHLSQPPQTQLESLSQQMNLVLTHLSLRYLLPETQLGNHLLLLSFKLQCQLAFPQTVCL